MAVESLIVGEGGRTAQVTEGLALAVSQSVPVLPDVGASSRLRFFSQLMDSVGDGTGDTNQNVDGSSTTQNFYVRSASDYDIHITALVIFLQDNSIKHSGFGDLSALTNGFTIGVTEAGVLTSLVDAAKSFSDLIIQTLAAAPFGDASRAFELDGVSGTQDAMILPMHLNEVIPGGIRIGRKTEDLLCTIIEDDLSTVTILTVRAMGYRHYPCDL